MKKILLVTKISRNFGALIQAYALKKTLEEMGAEVRTLNLNFPQTAKSYRALPSVTGWHTLWRFLQELRVYPFKRIAIRRSLLFREDYLSLTKSYPSFDAVQQDPPRADIYITGSDQVWNPLNNYDKSYYLLFGKPETVRASYAASIALNGIPEDLKEDFPARVRNMDFVSVREESGKNLLEEYNINAQVHLDPTLLLEREEYEKLLVRPSIRGPYVLLYLLTLPRDSNKIVERLRILYPKRKVVCVLGTARAVRLGDIQVASAGPREFLGLIRYADAFVTTSFHGTVFAGVFETDFAVILPPKVGGRITNLLEMVNMEKHIVSDADQITPMVLHQERPMLTSGNLRQKKKESLTYLQTILNSPQ